MSGLSVNKITCISLYHSRSYVSRFTILVSLTLLINGLEINLSKRRCILTYITRNLEPASRLENSDHHSLHDRGLSHDAPNNSCKQRYIVPVVWHVIIDLNKRGDVSDAILRRQIDILNGNLLFRIREFDN